MADLKDHAHKFDSLEGIAINRVQERYMGSPSDKSILYYKCKCGEKEAFEFGSTEDMKALKLKLEADREPKTTPM